MTENHLLRFMAGHDFVPAEALTQIKTAETFLIEQRLWEVKGPAEFQNLVNMKILTIGGHDKEGRPSIIAKSSKFLPANISPEEMVRGSMYIISFLMKNLPAHLDSMCVISDMGDLGWANFDRSHANLRL